MWWKFSVLTFCPAISFLDLSNARTWYSIFYYIFWTSLNFLDIVWPHLAHFFLHMDFHQVSKQSRFYYKTKHITGVVTKYLDRKRNLDERIEKCEGQRSYRLLSIVNCTEESCEPIGKVKPGGSANANYIGTL